MVKKGSDSISVLVVGIGGYGFYYLKTLMEEFPPGKINLAGVVDPFAKKSEYFEKIKKLNIPVFSQVEDFFKTGNIVDLTVISSPIHFHISQSKIALKNGSNVLCDKPLGAVIQEVDELIKVRENSGKWIMIGYQWSFSRAIQSLKKDIIKGLFGKPVRLKTLIFWPRDNNYYNRNDWAGKIKTKDGRWILDSPANNAMAHFLHNLFYVTGEKTHLSSKPGEVTAELYRAYPIENYDTAVCRIYTIDNTELLFYGSHTTCKEKGPIFNFEFEDAVISYGEFSDKITATDRKGNKKSYGSPEDDFQFFKLFQAVEHVNNPGSIICGPEAASSQTLCANGMQEFMPNISVIGGNLVQKDIKENRLWIKGLDEILTDCYQKNILPGEANISWAKKEKPLNLKEYCYFPEGKLPNNQE